MSSLPFIKAWLWISALASVAGWLLSAMGQLNGSGYLVFFAASAASLFIWKVARVCNPSVEFGNGRVCNPSLESGNGRERRFTNLSHSAKARFKHRFRHWLPASFTLLTLLILISGVLYPPSNYSGLSYRTPRVLQWLAEGHWFWIHTPSYRMNDRACGFEWLTAPLLLLTKSDRTFFLLNFIPFFLMPGQLFSLFTRCGVQARVAWFWMWLVPTGYSFLLQAGSIGNDTFSTLYALAAVDFALRARASKRFSDVAYSIVAAALLTGAKPSNLPLLLPWGLLMISLAPLFFRNPIRTAAISLVAILASFAPSALLNIHYCGDWSGLSLERQGMSMKSPFVGVWGNLLLLGLNNFVPPVFPIVNWWNHAALTTLPRCLVAPMTANFEQGFHLLWELPGEDWAGLGFGVSTLVLTSLIASLCLSKRDKTVRKAEFREAPAQLTSPPLSNPKKAALPRYGLLQNGFGMAILVSPWIALLAFCMKSGMVTAARLISPYYPLLLPAILILPGQRQLLRSRWWRLLAFAMVLIAFLVLIVNPARPLWPARTILSKRVELKPGSRFATRALAVYNVYSQRSDPLAHIRKALPNNLKTVGFLADGDDLDISLWRPFFSRKVEHILLRDHISDIRSKHIQYAVVGGAHLMANQMDIDTWLARTGAELVLKTTAILKISEGVQPWYIVKFP